MKKFIIVTEPTDVHARAVAWALKQLGIDSHFFNLRDFPSRQLASLRINQDSTHCSTIVPGKSNFSFPFTDGSTVWARRFPSNGAYFDVAAAHPLDINNVIHESIDFALSIQPMWAIGSRKITWINPLESAYIAESKPAQLVAAAKAGFRIPDTLISNNPNEIREFSKKHEDHLIAKPFRPRAWVENERSMWQPATVVSKESLQDDASLQVCPLIYQPRVPKAFELRLAVFGDRMIAGKLSSQIYKHTAVDWRLDSRSRRMPIEPYPVEATLKLKIHTLFSDLGITMGVVDLIVTDDEDFVFLEVNTQGQFLFLDSSCPSIDTFGAALQFFFETLGGEGEQQWPRYNEYRNSGDYSLVLAELQEEKAYDDSFRVHSSFVSDKQ